MKKLSIIIVNHNYERYLRPCIESALSVWWPLKEIIFVDDGSTDESLKTATEFEEQIKVIQCDKIGQIRATNRGISEAEGDCLVFLDSDDMLKPNLAAEISKVWTEQISKVQFVAEIIDQNGIPTGEVYPHFTQTISAKKISKWYQSTLTYPCSIGTSNAYHRKLLEQVFPLSDICGSAADSILLATAPCFGEVVSVNKILSQYRAHDNNQGHLSGFQPAKFTRELIKASQRAAVACSFYEKQGIQIKKSTINKSLHFLQYRACSFVFNEKNHPIKDDCKTKILGCIKLAFISPQGNSWSQQLGKTFFILAIILLPLDISKIICQERFSKKRSAAVTKILKILKII